jgi:hypothetical protein
LITQLPNVRFVSFFFPLVHITQLHAGGGGGGDRASFSRLFPSQGRRYILGGFVRLQKM